MPTSPETIIADLYKTESKRLIAVLTRLFGPHNSNLAEDVLQDAFTQALKKWKKDGIPKNPSAWLMSTAKNKAIDSLRANKTRTKFTEDIALQLESEWALTATIDDEFQDEKIRDDQLRMIFMCCQEHIKPENRLPFILKNLCGLTVHAISRALLISEELVKKRLQRTRSKLRDSDFSLPSHDKLGQAMESVHTALYLLFNEGFHSTSERSSINTLFCYEALHLVGQLINEHHVVNKETFALFALMHFHIARLDTRLDNDGHNIALDLQERGKWNTSQIRTGSSILKLADEIPSPKDRFYFEAQIAREHCQATSFKDTCWNNIVDFYVALIAIDPSPIIKLNHAVALAYAGQTVKARENTIQLSEHPALKKSHMPNAILAHISAMNGDRKTAYYFAREAKGLGGTDREHQLMMQQLDRLLLSHA